MYVDGDWGIPVDGEISPSRAFTAQPTNSLRAAKLPRNTYFLSWPAIPTCRTAPSRTPLKNFAARGVSSVPTVNTSDLPFTDPSTPAATSSSTQALAGKVPLGNAANRSSNGPTEVWAAGPPISRLAGARKAMNSTWPEPFCIRATNASLSPLPKCENTRHDRGTSFT